MSFKTVFIFYLYCAAAAEAFLHLQLRAGRHCRNDVNDQQALNSLNSQVENKYTLIFCLLVGIVFILLFLGLIKGLIGLFLSPGVGICGLHLLIDLPRPLNRYQEKELQDHRVIYDVGGWPIHPETKEKTVRVLEKRTEFCLNVIFFLAYPLAAMIYVCSLCCCIKNYQESNDEDCFESVNVISMNKGLNVNDDCHCSNHITVSQQNNIPTD